MNETALALGEITGNYSNLVGGKAWALSKLIEYGIRIPSGLCITTSSYRTFILETGLEDDILLELNRKTFENMRWEEIWDLSLRIRNLFLSKPFPQKLQESLEKIIEERFNNIPVVVRSSSPSEDSTLTSFAGLHESYVNVKGTSSILKSIKLVWASLWSDSALLYRKELNLDARHSSMAVVIQELESGERSGVAFSINPLQKKESVVEAVWGLNEGLVNGTVEPDRWTIARENGQILSHKAPDLRDITIQSSDNGTISIKSDPEEFKEPPLSFEEVTNIWQLAMRSENFFGSPQDVEWTIKDGRIFLLQSRPITSGAFMEDERQKYLSLKVGFEKLKKLRNRIENELLPAMNDEAERMSRLDLGEMNEGTLAGEIRKRMGILENWNKVYARDFIPFAHGTRLFGQFYNDRIAPDDPFEFVQLLEGTEMKSLERNRKIMDMAQKLQNNPELRKIIEDNKSLPAEMEKELEGLAREFHLSSGEEFGSAREQAISFILEMSTLSEKHSNQKVSLGELSRRFLENFSDDEKEIAMEYLDLARASWKLRDDDNLYLAAIENEVNRSILEGKKRISGIGNISKFELSGDDVSRCLEGGACRPETGMQLSQTKKVTAKDSFFYRQAKGQPASPGTGTGKARVIKEKKDLLKFKKGEILVCDAIEPDMTFIVPLAAGIVERRGGMLIHGAIIAREYGIPCVTGVPAAAEIIMDGSTVTVDGYLGIVIVEEG